MTDLELLFQVLFETLTLFFMLVGLVGLLVPIFPGLTVMWLATLVYALVQVANQNIHWIELGALRHHYAPDALGQHNRQLHHCEKGA